MRQSDRMDGYGVRARSVALPTDEGLWVLWLAGLAGLCVLLLCGCPRPALGPGVQLSEVVQEADTEAITVSGGLRAVDSDGKNLVFTLDDVQVSVQVFDADGALVEEPEVELVTFDDSEEKVSENARSLDVVLVADNSGSEEGNLEIIQSACRGFIRSLIPPAPVDRNRVGIVRVSTCATVMSELTPDNLALDDTVEQMFITNGWTALFDGIRIANEVLERGAASKTPVADRTWRAIIVFTDARENNSAGERTPDIFCDDIDTVFDNLVAQEINGVVTPVFTVGIGNDIDEDMLLQLAELTGGFYRRLRNFAQLTEGLTEEGDLVNSLIPLSFQVRSPSGRNAKIAVTVVPAEGEMASGDFEIELVGLA